MCNDEIELCVEFIDFFSRSNNEHNWEEGIRVGEEAWEETLWDWGSGQLTHHINLIIPCPRSNWSTNTIGWSKSGTPWMVMYSNLVWVSWPLMSPCLHVSNHQYIVFFTDDIEQGVSDVASYGRGTPWTRTNKQAHSNLSQEKSLDSHIGD